VPEKPQWLKSRTIEKRKGLFVTDELLTRTERMSSPRLRKYHEAVISVLFSNKSSAEKYNLLTRLRFNPEIAKTLGINLAVLKSTGLSVTHIRFLGYDKVISFRFARYTLEELVHGGFSLLSLVEGGFEDKELLQYYRQVEINKARQEFRSHF